MPYTLIGADGRPHAGDVPGTLGGHRRSRVYGRLDCAGALRWIERGHYVAHRVFFLDEATALAAGYRPCGGCLRERYARWKRGEVAVRLPAREPFAAGRLLAFLGARAVPGVEAVEGATFHRTLSLPGGPGTVALSLDAGGADAEIRVADPRDAGAAVRACRRLLDLDADPATIDGALGSDPLLGPLVSATPGLRSPGTANPGSVPFVAFEVVVRAVVGQQVSVAGARTVLGRLAAAHGEPLPDGRRLFPSAERLARVDPATLPMPAARARTLVAVARAAPDLDPERLLSLPGIGPWTAGYVALRLGDPDVVLPTDLGVRRALAGLGAPSDPRAIAALAERWRPWRSYATHHLWAVSAARTRPAARR